MKKIVLFVLMIITSVNLFSNEIPDDILLDYEKALNLYDIVIEDVIYEDFNMEDESVYESLVHDDTFGYIFYQIILHGNIENGAVNIFHGEKVYTIVISRKEMLKDYFFTVGVIEVHNKEEDILLYSIRFFDENGDNILESFSDHRTNEHYTNNKYK